MDKGVIVKILTATGIAVFAGLILGNKFNSSEKKKISSIRTATECAKFSSSNVTKWEYFLLASVDGCVQNQIVDVNQEQNYVTFDIGLVDRMGNVHKYRARMGGIDSSGKRINPGVCSKSQENYKCETVEIDNFVTKFKTGGINADIILEDTAPWENSKIVSNEVDFFLKLRSALTTGENFPDGEGKVIQMWKLWIYE